MKEAFININPDSSSLIWTARLYSTVFATPPWNEMFARDGRFFGRYTDEGSDHALSWQQLGLQRAYPLKNTVNYIKKELARADAMFVQIPELEGTRILGFGWGFSYPSAEDLVNDKWQSPNQQDREKVLNTIQRYTGASPLWYLSEVGVNPRLQNQGIGSLIVSTLLRNVKSFPIIMRANAYSPMVSIASKSQCGFKQIMGFSTRKIVDENMQPVLIAQKDIIINQIDPLNPDRVLFFKPQIDCKSL